MNREQRRAAASDERRAATQTPRKPSKPPTQKVLPMIGTAIVITIIGYVVLTFLAIAFDLM